MKSNLAKLMSMVVFSSVFSAHAYGQYRPDCIKKNSNKTVLKFYGEQIYAPRAAEQIKIKKLLRQNCRISQRDLDSISKVIVAGKTYGGSSKLWLETSSGATRSKFLTMGNRRHAPVERLVFDLRRGESYGKTQLFIKGDIDLKRIAVVFDQTTRTRYSRDVVAQVS